MGRYSANNKTLEWGREKGWYLWRVESYNHISGFKTDLYHIIDYLGITEDQTIGIQICGSDFLPHWRKIFLEERTNTRKWLSNPNRSLVLIGWRKVKRAGRMVYRPRIMWFKMQNNVLDYFQEK